MDRKEGSPPRSPPDSGRGRKAGGEIILSHQSEKNKKE